MTVVLKYEIPAIRNSDFLTTGKTCNKTCNTYYIIEKSQIMDSIFMTTLIK